MVVEERLGEGGHMSEGLHMGEDGCVGAVVGRRGKKKKKKKKKKEKEKEKEKKKKKKYILRIQLTKRVRKYHCTREHLVLTQSLACTH